MTTLTATFTPAELEALEVSGPSGRTCVVFDVLRATSSMITALHNGAVEILPASTIHEALSWRDLHPECLLAGERNGVRIEANLTGGVSFALGNSPREFEPDKVRGKSIVMTTTNGTRALRACNGARTTLICSFLNLGATADYLTRMKPQDLVLVAGGTGEHMAYEDVLCAGALADLLWSGRRGDTIEDSVLMARRLYRLEEQDLLGAFGASRNGQRLLANPQLRDDVAFCTRRDCYPVVAGTSADGAVRVIGSSGLD